MSFRPWVVFEQDSGGNSGGGDDAAQQGLKNLLQRHNNDAMALAGQLYSENYELRTTRRQLREELEQTKKKLPAEGTVVITAEEAKAFEAYKKLGKPEELETARTEIDTLKRGLLLDKAAALLEYRPGVLKKLADGLQISLREETVDGKVVETPIVTEGDKAISLKEFAEKNWPDFIPALLAADSKTPPVSTFIKQPGTGSGAKPISLVQARIDARKKREADASNPLMKKKE